MMKGKIMNIKTYTTRSAAQRAANRLNDEAGEFKYAVEEIIDMVLLTAAYVVEEVPCGVRPYGCRGTWH